MTTFYAEWTEMHKRAMAYLGITHGGNTCHVVAFQHHVSDLNEKDARALRRSPVVGTVEQRTACCSIKDTY
jgi:hypothetical protein